MNVDRITPDTADEKRIHELAVMMMDLKHETDPGAAVDDFKLYLKYMKQKIYNSYVYHISGVGFMIIDRVHDPLLTWVHQDYWILSHIYIVPAKRKRCAYSMLLNTMLNNHPGQIIGLTYKNSDHNAVMQKRYATLGTIYGRY